MNSLAWAVLVALGMIVVGRMTGIAGSLLWPLVGVIVLIGIVLVIFQRRSEAEPPVR